VIYEVLPILYSIIRKGNPFLIFLDFFVIFAFLF
jgi:hypothetical protein